MLQDKQNDPMWNSNERRRKVAIRALTQQSEQIGDWLQSIKHRFTFQNGFGGWFHPTAIAAPHIVDAVVGPHPDEPGVRAAISADVVASIRFRSGPDPQELAEENVLGLARRRQLMQIGTTIDHTDRRFRIEIEAEFTGDGYTNVSFVEAELCPVPPPSPLR